MDFNSIVIKLIENNPNVLGTLMSVFLVPVAIVFLNNRHQRNIKMVEMESQMALKKLEKELDQKDNKHKSAESQEDLTYAALTKILFDVQMLYADLSVPSCNDLCVNDSLTKFRNKLYEHQSEIANNQLQLSPKIIDIIYKFYRLISNLTIDLINNKDKSLNISLRCVSGYSEKLADTVIEYQKEILIQRHKEVPVELNNMVNFRSCCGGGEVR